ncbi:MAG TPA: S1/P1 nuclease [Chitinophagaceae bacterium]|nr:S1/P1 nuclease [Chitinophagaceae bacterium]
MRTKLFKGIALLVVSFFLSFSSFANWWWGMTGHRVVGEIAESYLTPKARAAVKAILGDESLAMAANWADFIKSDSNFNYLNPWHYVNMKGGLTRDEVVNILKPDTGVNLYAKMNFIIRELKKKNLEKEKKIMYLRLLIHFVGDLHQPLHVGGRPEDLGGNRVRVLWFNDSTNLHSVWDDKLPEYQKLSYTEWAKAINHTTAKQRTGWQKAPIYEWFFESYKAAQDIYAEITRPYQRLSYRYNFDHIDTINEQLLKGGVRLAGLLNDIFK